jgi:hypothetical protein
MVANSYIPLAEASKEILGHPHISTLHRWAMRGVRGVKLDTVVVGHRRFVTKEAIDQFLAELNETDNDRLAKEGC